MYNFYTYYLKHGNGEKIMNKKARYIFVRNSYFAVPGLLYLLVECLAF